MHINRYQVIFILAASFLVFTCVRSYSPFPQYSYPRTPIVKAEPLPDPDISVEAILEQKPHWLSTSRDPFQVHADLTQKIIKPQVPTPVTPPRPKYTIIALGPPQPPPRPAPTPVPTPPQPVLPPVLPPRPPTPTPGGGGPTPGGQGTPPEPAKPYELPFVFQGIVRADEAAGPMVILRDKESGKVVRRSEGEVFEGVHIRKIAPNSVEVEVPSEGLQFRYIDNLRKWVAL